MNLKDATDFINFIKKKDSERSDTRFNGRNELTHKYTPPPPNFKALTGENHGQQMVLDFANEVQILDKGTYKPLVWKRYIEDIISLLHTSRGVVNQFNEQANEYHPTIKFTAEISVSEATSLDATFYRGKRFKRELVLDVRILFKPTEVFQDTFDTTFHPPGAEKGFRRKAFAARPLSAS